MYVVYSIEYVCVCVIANVSEYCKLYACMWIREHVYKPSLYPVIDKIDNVAIKLQLASLPLFYLRCVCHDTACFAEINNW